MTKDEKTKAVQEFMKLTSERCLTFFKIMQLEWGMEQMVIDQNDNNKEYVLSFKTIEKHLEDLTNKCESRKK